MKVVFEFEDKHGSVATANTQEVEMDESELLALFKADEITFPKELGNGSYTSAKATIKSKEFDMYRLRDKFLKVTLKEV